MGFVFIPNLPLDSSFFSDGIASFQITLIWNSCMFLTGLIGMGLLRIALGFDC